jgi:NAD(P)-dependent dehydrogenase (short-subunit alcohol dehydrogenase family)
MDITDSTVMITGGARIGRRVALALARAGAANFLLSYHQSKSIIEETAEELKKLGAQVIIESMDARRESDVRQSVDNALKNFGAIDILINMASTYQARVIEKISLSEWHDDFDANATSALLCMAAVAPEMRRRGNGRIINFVDWTAASGRVGYHDYATYYAAKCAVLGLTEAFALEYAPEVLINCIAPGPILPPPDLAAEIAAQIAESTPLKRWGGADEIAEAVIFFARSNFITGECLRVDGGRHLI